MESSDGLSYLIRERVLKHIDIDLSNPKTGKRPLFFSFETYSKPGVEAFKFTGTTAEVMPFFVTPPFQTTPDDPKYENEFNRLTMHFFGSHALSPEYEALNAVYSGKGPRIVFETFNMLKDRLTNHDLGYLAEMLTMGHPIWRQNIGVYENRKLLESRDLWQGPIFFPSTESGERVEFGTYSLIP